MAERGRIHFAGAAAQGWGQIPRAGSLRGRREPARRRILWGRYQGGADARGTRIG